jgi:hypothetical protein
MVRWSDTGENVPVNYTNSAYTCNKFTKKIKKIEFFSPTLLRHFQLKKSDSLGIFKNILTEFYSIIYLSTNPPTHLYIHPSVHLLIHWPPLLDFKLPCKQITKLLCSHQPCHPWAENCFLNWFCLWYVGIQLHINMWQTIKLYCNASIFLSVHTSTQPTHLSIHPSVNHLHNLHS